MGTATNPLQGSCLSRGKDSQTIFDVERRPKPERKLLAKMMRSPFRKVSALAIGTGLSK